MKQTAVEWLVKKYFEDYNVLISELEFQQAKEMEKQQLIDCGNACALFQHIQERKVNMMSLEELEKYAEEDVINCGEKYYKEKFKKK